MANNRIQIKRTSVAGRFPNTTDPSNTQYIAAGELALNMADKALYTSDGSQLITVGGVQATGTFSDSILIGDAATNLLTINSTAVFAGNTSVSTLINANAITVSNTTSNISVSPSNIFAGNNTTNVTIDMTGGVQAVAIASANINSQAIVTIQTATDHGITLLTQSKLLVNTSYVSLNTANYSVDYSLGFDIRDIPTPNTITFVLPNDSFINSSPGNRTVTSINRASNGIVTVVTAGPHLYTTGDKVYVTSIGYSLADFYISNGKTANVINSTTLQYSQTEYASVTKSLSGATAYIYTPPIDSPATTGPYYLSIEAADPVFDGFNPGDTISLSGLQETITGGFNNNAYSPSFFNGNQVIFAIQVNRTGYKTILIPAGVITKNEVLSGLTRYLYPKTALTTLTQGSVIISYAESGRVNNNSQLCPILANTAITGSISAVKPTGISLKNNDKLVYVLDNILFVGNNTIGNIVDSKGSRAFRPYNTPSTPTFIVRANKYFANEGDTITFTIVTTNFGINGAGTLYWTNSGTTVGDDFTDGNNSGSVSILNGSGFFTLTLKNDVLREGPETIVIDIRTGSAAGPVVAVSDFITVNDTSIPPYYSITPDVTSIDEGGSAVTYTVYTEGVSAGSVLYWKNVGTTVAADFTDNVNSGSVTIDSRGYGTITRTAVLDALIEGTENIRMQLLVGSVNGTVVASATTVTVKDKTPINSITVDSTFVYLNEYANFTITTTVPGTFTFRGPLNYVGFPVNSVPNYFSGTVYVDSSLTATFSIMNNVSATSYPAPRSTAISIYNSSGALLMTSPAINLSAYKR